MVLSRKNKFATFAEIFRNGNDRNRNISLIYRNAPPGDLSEPFRDLSKPFGDLSKPFRDLSQPFGDLSEPPENVRNKDSINPQNKTAMKDYIPHKDSELVAWSANFSEQLAVHSPAWQVPSDEVADLQTANSAFAALHAQADSPAKNSVIVARKNAARKTLVKKIRDLVNFRLKNPIITDDQRVELGLHVRDTTPTTIPAPKTRPELDLDVLDFRRIKVVFRDQGSSSKAKPYGVNGAVIVYAVLDTPPADQSALTRSTLATRTPHTLEFTEEERGKTVYVAICWQNEKGEKGPWSEIESAIVP